MVIFPAIILYMHACDIIAHGKNGGDTDIATLLILMLLKYYPTLTPNSIVSEAYHALLYYISSRLPLGYSIAIAT